MFLQLPCLLTRDLLAMQTETLAEFKQRIKEKLNVEDEVCWRARLSLLLAYAAHRA